jgi:hypothetical protein
VTVLFVKWCASAEGRFRLGESAARDLLLEVLLLVLEPASSPPPGLIGLRCAGPEPRLFAGRPFLRDAPPVPILPREAQILSSSNLTHRSVSKNGTFVVRVV